jgi:hypothetical protein
MKILITITILIFSFVAISTHADSLFEDAYLSDLHVVDVDQHTGWALIQDRMGNQGDVSVGDEIGWEQAVVVDIQKAAITVEQEELKTRMPVVNPFAGN